MGEPAVERAPPSMAKERPRSLQDEVGEKLLVLRDAELFGHGLRSLVRLRVGQATNGNQALAIALVP